MNPIASTRTTVLDVVRDAADLFHRRGDGHEVDGLEEVSPEVASLLSRELRTADEWARSPTGEAEEEDEMEGGDDYVSHDPVIALVQAALDEHADEHPQEKHGKGVSLLRLIARVLGKRAENYVEFRKPESLDGDVFDLPESCRVALVGDWGTAKDRARRVARAIAARRPDHIIHLGDIYPSGTRSRAHKRFIDVWMEEVGSGPKYWAMNGNHEMNANGEGYFLDVLPWCGQRASFFCLRNEHWKLIAIDSAYADHDLEPSQFDWLMHQLSNGPDNNILLSHHQMFSAVDRRPRRNAHKLPARLQPAVDTGRIFGWFWGHEHRSLYYTRDPRFGNYLARCIGHGGKRVRITHNVHLGPEFAPPVAHYWNVPRPDRDDRAMNGFALLTFDGSRLTIEYVDETGRTCFTEIWPDTPIV
ncbi:metallophosphoesterase family protein [Longimicrobium sp.]|uniref:metallophosphoesterase family protein n=1 Tax=Longimicrobium sp. TaxID=2029185 RepID=UPI002C14D30A|nr:metallophosphoesterase [Longimicrobium sp.]HSU14430.1 metallophosphoesterase [Longimicrobium sp.]